MKTTNRLTAAAVALFIGAGIIAAPIAARASDEGRRNTALGLGAAAAALLLTQRDKTPGIVAGVGALLAASQIGHDRDRWRGDRYYDSRYNDRYDYRYSNRYDRDVRYDRNDRSDRYDRYDRNNRDDRYYHRDTDRSYNDNNRRDGRSHR